MMLTRREAWNAARLSQDQHSERCSTNAYDKWRLMLWGSKADIEAGLLGPLHNRYLIHAKSNLGLEKNWPRPPRGHPLHL